MYGVCLIAGILLAWLLARSLAKGTGVHGSHVDLLVPVIMAAGIAGAYAFGSWTDFLTASPANGTVLLGSLLLATAAGIGYALLNRIPLGLIGDIVAAPIALGIACGRIGCFAAGCCYGTPVHSPLPAVRFPQNSFAWRDQVARQLLAGGTESLPVHPVQLYEAGAAMILAILLCWNFRQRRLSGERFLALAMAYPVVRFFLEFLRADNPGIYRGLTFSQLASIAVLGLAVGTLLMRRRLAMRLGLHLEGVAWRSQ